VTASVDRQRVTKLTFGAQAQPLLDRLDPQRRGSGDGISWKTAERLVGRESLAQLVERVRAEFVESPGLSVTCQQAQVLWGLDAVTADAILRALVDVNFLTCTSKNAYVRAG
jgi:hypothetical protein